MSEIRIPDGFRWEPIERGHPRSAFHCGEAAVDEWLKTKALQHHKKRLSNTTVLVSPDGRIAGFYTIAASQVDFSDLPMEIAKTMPKRSVPVAVLAWMGVDSGFHRQGLGERLVSKALRDCFEAGKTFAMVAVVIDCLNESVKSFYDRWNFREMPGQSLRLYLSAQRLDAMMTSKEQ
jgi:ribosomal protein S18 acetylase RimI-like enzyme